MVKHSYSKETRPRAVIYAQIVVALQLVIPLVAAAYLLVFEEIRNLAEHRGMIIAYVVFGVVLIGLSFGLYKRNNAARSWLIGVEALIITAQVFILLAQAPFTSIAEAILSTVVLVLLSLDDSREWFENKESRP